MYLNLYYKKENKQRLSFTVFSYHKLCQPHKFTQILAIREQNLQPSS